MTIEFYRSIIRGEDGELYQATVKRENSPNSEENIIIHYSLVKNMNIPSPVKFIEIAVRKTEMPKQSELVSILKEEMEKL